MGKIYEQEIARVEQLAFAEGKRLEQLVSGLAKAKAAEEFRLYSLKEQQGLEDKLLATQRQIADLTLTDIEKGYRDIARAADDSAKAAVRAEEARRGEKLNPQEIEAYYKKAREGVAQLTTAQKKLNSEARTFSTGWKKAFADYTDNATNAAKAAERLFEKFTSGIEDLLVNFAKTGKFEWKNFVADMAEELLRSQIKQTLASVLQMPNPFSSSGGSVSDLFGGMFGDLLGGSGASKGQSANNPMYVLDVGQGGGGGLFGGMMGPQQPQQQGGGIMGTIGNIFGGIKDTVGSVFGGIGDAIGGVVGSIGSIFGGGPSAPSTTSGGGFGGGIVDSIGSIFSGGDSGGGFLDSITSSIGDFFGGFFANGGNIPAGKFGMVGERGPEFISGPATITPMGGSSAVTYNIQAVDARSFQQLLASDPSFIYALTEQGRKSFAGAR
jgi:lambda family phage tail tape measure protein